MSIDVELVQGAATDAALVYHWLNEHGGVRGGGHRRTGIAFGYLFGGTGSARPLRGGFANRFVNAQTTRRWTGGGGNAGLSYQAS